MSVYGVNKVVSYIGMGFVGCVTIDDVPCRT